VRVVYLTCGDREPGTERARRRCEEAKRAWGSVGVDASQSAFSGSANSPLAGPSLIDARQSEWARERVVQ